MNSPDAIQEEMCKFVEARIQAQIERKETKRESNKPGKPWKSVRFKDLRTWEKEHYYE
jgi:hypothetical protein